MGDRLTHHEGADQVLDGSGLTAVGSEVERVQTSVEGELFKQSRHQWAIRIYVPLGAQLVEHGEVGVGVIDVISIRRVLVPCPLVGCGHI